MFAKPRDVAGAKEHRLSGKDGKKLIERIAKALPKASVDLLKDKLGFHHKAGLVVAKVANKVQLFGVGDGADRRFLFVDPDGHNERFFPTVHALWLAPQLLAPLYVHAPVSRFVFNGSDVMLPGVVREREESVRGSCFGLGKIVKGEIRVLFAYGNPAPFAVGEMLVDTDGIYHGGFQGRGMRVLHMFGDALWGLNGKGAPNDFFFSNRVEALPGAAPDSSDSEGDECDPEAEQGANESEEGAGLTAERPPPAQGYSSAQCGDQIADDDQIVPGSDGSTHVAEAVAAGLHAAAAAQQSQSSDGQDPARLVIDTFLQSIKRHIKPRDLPMLTNQFFSSVMLPSRPAGTTVDLKQTPFKKVGKFLASMEERGLIMMRRESNGVESITSIESSHPDLRAFEGWALEDEHRATECNDEVGAPKVVQIAEFRRALGPDVMEVVRAAGLPPGCGPKKDHYLASDMRTAFAAYVEQERLQDPSNPRLIALNPTLTRVLFGSAKKNKSAPPPGTMDRGKATSLFVDSLSTGHQVTYPDGTVTKFRPGPAPQIEVAIEQRQGNKWVTRFWNLEVFGLEPEKVASAAQLKFSSSCTTQARPGKSQDIEVVVQGKVTKELPDFLQSEYGLHPNRHVKLPESKKGGKGGRKGK